MSKSGPISFYFLNHFLEKEELRRQLKSLKEQGFSGVFMHVRDGNQVPYLSDLWFDNINFIIGECIRIGLDPWLYDEDPFPSGAAGGLVTARNAEYKAQTLNAVHHSVGNSVIDITVPMANILGIYAVSKNRHIRTLANPWINITSKSGTVRNEWDEIGKIRGGYYTPYLNEAMPHYRAAAGSPTIRIFHQGKEIIDEVIVVSAVQFKGGVWGDYPDLMNRKAAESFILLTHQEYRNRIKKDFWKYIPGIFLDESKLMPFFPWNEAILARYEKEFGESLANDLPHLFENYSGRSLVIRNNYRVITGKLFNENFFKPISTWCKKNGIRFTGHTSPEEQPYSQQMYTPNLMTLLKSFDLPGIDLISSLHGSQERPMLNIGAKVGESSRYQAGRKEYLVEAFGVSGENLDGDRMRSMADWCFSFGINRICIHGQFYSLDGPRKREAPPSIFYQAPYWSWFKAFSAYIARVSDILKTTVRKSAAAYLYPTSFFNTRTTEDFCSRKVWDKSNYQHANDIGKDIIRLSANRIQFDFVDDIEFETATLKDKRLIVGKMRYKFLLVPNVPMLSEKAIVRIKQLIKNKFPVYFLGKLPCTLDGRDLWSGIRTMTTKADQFQQLYKKYVETIDDPLHIDLKLPQTCTVRELFGKKERYYFFYNQGSESGKAELFTRGACDFQYLDPNESVLKKLTPSGSNICIDLLPQKGCLIKQTLAKKKADHAKEQDCKIQTHDLSSGVQKWKIERLNENVLPLTRWEMLLGKNKKETINLPVGALRKPGEASGVKVPSVFIARFMVKDRLENINLLADRETINQFEIYVNSRKINNFISCHYFDESNRCAQINRFIKNGINTVTLKAMIDPAIARHCFKEMVYITGDFALKKWNKESVLTEDCKVVERNGIAPWHKLGWPYYSGVVRYSTEIVLQKKINMRYYLEEIEYPGSFAKIVVNEKECGILYTKPYQLDITAGVRDGINMVVIESANTIENVIEGRIVPSGIRGRVRIVEQHE